MNETTRNTEPRLITIDRVSDILYAPKVDVERWISEGKIEVHSTRAFYKWGRSLNARMFDLDKVLAAAAKAPQWRIRFIKDLQKKHPNKQFTVKDIPKLLGATVDEVTAWIEDGRIPVAGTSKRSKYAVPVQVFDPEALKLLTKKVASWRKKDEKDKKANQARFEARKLKIAKELRVSSGFSDYPSLFPLARKLKRKLIFLCGPTNSGKTHEALHAACAAKTAEVLSPLRLLALEHFDLLHEKGLSAGLVTGEEKRGDPGATHVARTLETADFSRQVDVAVIDEIQMLADPQRGWAWTAAAVGIPATTVYMTGSPDAEPLVKKIAKITGDELEIRRLERKSPLKARYNCGIEDLRAGDAVIVFSRRDAHEVREKIRSMAHLSVATIYGALGPEVRNTEAKRFTSGEASVLVATDAIGMGLNLGNIQRVLFTSTKKYDGKRERTLTPSEIRQIGGRAGRFGKALEGYVGTVKIPGLDRWADFSVIKEALESSPKPLKSRLLISPTKTAVRLASETLQTKSLPLILSFLRMHLAKANPHFEIADIEEMEKVADLTQKVAQFDLGDRFTFTCAPVQANDEGLITDLRGYMNYFEMGRIKHFQPTSILETLDGYEREVKRLSLYIWLAMKWPNIFVDYEMATANRHALQAKIEDFLYKSSIPKSPEEVAALKKREEEKRATRKARLERKRLRKQEMREQRLLEKAQKKLIVST